MRKRRKPIIMPRSRLADACERCAIAQVRDDREETTACLRRSAKLGYEPARFKLQMAGIPLEE